MNDFTESIEAAHGVISDVGAERLTFAIGVPYDQLKPFLEMRGAEIADYATIDNPTVALSMVAQIAMLHGFLLGWIISSNLPSSTMRTFVFLERDDDDV